MTGPAPDDAATLANFARETRRAVAVANVYVYTNTIRDVLERRLEAIQHALDAGATHREINRALAGADRHAPPTDHERSAPGDHGTQ